MLVLMLVLMWYSYEYDDKIHEIYTCISRSFNSFIFKINKRKNAFCNGLAITWQRLVVDITDASTTPLSFPS